MHPAPHIAAGLRHHLRGFSLVEALIVVTIIGFVTAFAIPSYAEYTRRAARADAQMVLLQVANDLERIYLQCNAYTKRYNPTTRSCEYDGADIINQIEDKYPQIPVTGTKRYSLKILTLGNQHYYLSAYRSKPQKLDRCGDLGLDSNGQRFNAPGVSVTDCWRR